MTYNLVHIATNIIYVYTIYLFIESFLGKEVYNENIKKVTYFVYFVFSTFIVLVTRVPITMLIFNFLSILIISLNYKTTFVKKFMVVVLICIVEIILEMIIVIIFNYTDLNVLKDSEFNSIIGLILIRICGLISAYQLSRYKLSFNKSYKIPKGYYLGVSFISLGSMFLFLNSLNNRSLDIVNVTISGLILVTINVMMILIDEKIYNSIILTQEKEILNQQNIAYENQNNIINQSNETIKILKHDMKNHIIMLNELYEENNTEEFKKYTEGMIKQIDSRVICSSNNFVIDSIVNFKLGTLSDSYEKIKVNVVIPQTLNIEAMDLTKILGNIIDNAVRGMLESEDNELDLKIDYALGNVIIKLKNSYNGNLIIENGSFKTTKESDLGHGLGIISVKETLKKYDGDIEIMYDNNTFNVIIIIPNEENT